MPRPHKQPRLASPPVERGSPPPQPPPPPPHPLRREGGVDQHIAAAAARLASQPSAVHMSTVQFCRDLVLSEQLGLPDFYVGLGQLLNWPRIAKQAIGETEWKRHIVTKPSPKPELPPLPTPLPSLLEISEAAVVPRLETINRRLDAVLSPHTCATLRDTGGVLLSGLLSSTEARTLLHALAAPGSIDPSPTYLRESQGNGCNGAYHEILRAPQALLTIADALAAALSAHGFPVKKRGKHLLLRYGVGGINYAHQDHTGFPYQCALMLSTPGTDFCGGATYVIDAVSKCVSELRYEAAGDAVVFAASHLANGRHMYHGMRRVEPVDANPCRRFAIGLYQ